MATLPTDLLILKNEGNTFCQNGEFLAAIERYDLALRLARNAAHAVPLLLNRSHARLQSAHFDAALADANAVLDMSLNKPPEKAVFRAARALYGLRRFKECLEACESLLGQYPGNKAGVELLARCNRRQVEETGVYDWKEVLDEAIAKSPSPDMDRATYVGLIEVRDCEIKEHGRGLFTTKDVKAGELLLCEKSFSAVFAGTDESGKPVVEKYQSREEEQEGGKIRSFELRAQLVADTLVKLYRNPSLIEAFQGLYPGPDATDELDEETGEVVVDENFVDSRITYNAFGFPVLTHAYHYAISHHPELVPDDLSASRGVWTRASYINHSCFPLVRRSFIGDMMIFRAQANIPKDTELKFGYISALEEFHERQAKLKKYGFDCDCQICRVEEATSGEMMGTRMELSQRIVALFEAGSSNGLHVYTSLLDQMEATYSTPPTLEYRRAMITPLTNLITGCLTSGLPLQVIELVHRLLVALGFQIDSKSSGRNRCFRILQWGFLIDEVVVSLVDLCDAYKGLGEERLLRDAEKEAKKAYLIMCGEDASWEDAYGGRTLAEGETRSGMGKKAEEAAGRVEDLVEGVAGGLKFV